MNTDSIRQLIEKCNRVDGALSGGRRFARDLKSAAKAAAAELAAIEAELAVAKAHRRAPSSYTTIAHAARQYVELQTRGHPVVRDRLWWDALVDAVRRETPTPEPKP